MKRQLLAVLALGVAQLIFAPTGFADDGKVVTSSACQGTFASDRDRAQYHTDMMRAVGGEVQMNCGLIRDNSGKKLNSVDARYDKNSSANTTIYGRVYSCNQAYHECSWKSGSMTNAGPGQHSIFIDTSTLPFSDTYGRYFSYYTRLPDGDEFMALEFVED